MIEQTAGVPEQEGINQRNKVILSHVKAWGQNSMINTNSILTIEQAILIEQLRALNAIRGSLSFIVFIVIAGIVVSVIGALLR